jgi:hypothetical protein
LPVLDRGESLKSRLRYDRVVSQYLRDMTNCLRQDPATGKVYLADKDEVPLVIFGSRLGAGVYGVAYMNTGKGLGRLLKFSSKIMNGGPQSKKEVDLLKRMSDMVRTNQCPNLPIMHAGGLCPSKCAVSICPKSTLKRETYHVVISELADGDMVKWLSAKRTSAQFQSVVMQMVFAIYAFHSLGYVHDDAHMGNFLFHKVKPGGCWRYRVKASESQSYDVFVPNVGYQVVLWDPGMAYKASMHHKNLEYKFDYERLFGVLYGYLAESNGLDVYMDDLDAVSDLILDTHYDYRSEELTIAKSLPSIGRVFEHVVVGPYGKVKPPTYVLNLKPFTLGRD